MIGALAGFLWFNCHPAQVFMGNTGALPLGGLLGLLAVVARQELLLVVVGGVFVAEAGSVILQVASYKWRRRRLFLCAPLHHHFQFRGWPENKIVVRFWIAAAFVRVGRRGRAETPRGGELARRGPRRPECPPQGRKPSDDPSDRPTHAVHLPMKRPLHLVFAGGGTAGHLFPGLAVAEDPVAPAGGRGSPSPAAARTLERRLVAAAGFDYFALPCRPLPRGPREAVSVRRGKFRRLSGRQAVPQARASWPRSSGWAATPACRWAGRPPDGVPLVLLEQNVVPGRATRWLARSADLLCTSFAETQVPAGAGVPCGSRAIRSGLAADILPRRTFTLGARRQRRRPMR